MKVTHVITGLGTGGAEAMLYKVILGSAPDIKQCVISLTKGGKHKQKLDALGVDVLELDLKRQLFFPWRWWSEVKNRLCKDANVVHAWMYHAMLFTTILSFFDRQPRAKLIWNVRHSLKDMRHEKPVLRLLIRLLGLLIHRTDKVIFNSTQSLQQHGAHWSLTDRSAVIPNGFNTDIWHPAEKGQENRLKQRLNIHNARILGHVGRVHPMKNHQGLLTAFSGLAKHIPDLHLVMIGKGTTELRINDPEVAKRVHCLGERQDIDSLMPCFDFFVLCSNWGEGFPNVLGEAMACNLPCLVTDVGDCAAILANEDWVIQPFSAAQLSNRLQSLVCLPEAEVRQLANDNRHRVVQHYSLPHIVGLYTQLYRDITT